jgi:hypothetical protein
VRRLMASKVKKSFVQKNFIFSLVAFKINQMRITVAAELARVWIPLR